MKILMLLSNPFTHDPRVYNEAKSLIKAGHEVTVLARDRKKVNPLNEMIDGISVNRVYDTKLLSILPYNLFDLFFWWKEGYKQSIKLYHNYNFEAIHCHNLDTLPIGIELKKKFGIPLIYDAHEIWGYMISVTMPWWKYYIKKEKRILKNVDKIITVNEPLKEYFNTISDKQVTIIMNCKPLQNNGYKPSKNDTFLVLYIGTIGKSRFLLELVDVVKEIPDINCKIAGFGDIGYLNELIKKCSDVKNVEYMGRIPMDEVVPMTKKSDVVICLFDPNNKNNKVGLPNKLFESMVCGRPIICSKGTYLGEFVKENKIGIVVEYKKDEFKKGIIELKNNQDLCEQLGKNALNAAINKYNWGNQKTKLVELYEKFKK